MAGIYGMNFAHMPELHLTWAYPLVWITNCSCGREPPNSSVRLK